MFRRVITAAIAGIDVHPVQVEVDVSDGLPCFVMVGYVSSQVREAQDRVRTALKNAGVSLPPKRITVNLAPADIRKDGSGFDLPIAAAILSATERIPKERLSGVFFAGELGLNGEIHGIPGILPMVLKAHETGCRFCIVPKDNLKEARIISEIPSAGVGSIQELLEFFDRGHAAHEHLGQLADSGDDIVDIMPTYDVDFADIQGQESAKRAALIAASGFHNLLLEGPPGSGKTMLAKRIPTILPPMTRKESLELTRIYSVAGLLPSEQPLITTRPFCAPHHTATPQALAGGGTVPRPGLISLSHRGCLFIDEMPEFSRKGLEILRQPLEERQITISRTGGTYCFPAEFILVAAMNPCPCGYYPDMNRCMCTPQEVKKYQSKISFPLLDRIDLYTKVSPVKYEDLKKSGTGNLSSRQMRSQVIAAQAIQKKRYEKEPFIFNSELPAGKIDQYCPLTPQASILLERIYKKLNLSARGYHRVIRIARTIADLDDSDRIDKIHISEAVFYRGMEGTKWKRQI